MTYREKEDAQRLEAIRDRIADVPTGVLYWNQGEAPISLRRSNVYVCVMSGGAANPEVQRDAHMLAHAREDIAWLLCYIDRLKKELASTTRSQKAEGLEVCDVCGAGTTMPLRFRAGTFCPNCLRRALRIVGALATC